MARPAKKEACLRAVIENVSPLVDGGRFPVKRIAGETVTVTADVFADGHDVVCASLHFRKKGQKKWRRNAMTFVENDHWRAQFKLEEAGFYEFRVCGWVDIFQTLHRNIQVKLNDGQDIQTELQAVSAYLSGLAKSASPPVSKKLHAWGESLVSGGDKKALSLLQNENLNLLINTRVPRERISTSPSTYLIRADRPRAGFSSWYEFFPRSFGHEPGSHGTFKSCRSILKPIADMGFDVIYLPPVHPIGQSRRKGKNNAVVCKAGDPGSPWAIGSHRGGHTALHPALGTLGEFKDFLEEAARLGLEVAIDIAFQCSLDHPWIKEYPAWFSWRGDGSIQYAENPPKKYEDIVPLNFETADKIGLWQALRQVFLYWIDNGVKIFRVDNPHTKGFSFWEWLIAEIHKKHPEVLFLAEAFTRPKVMYRLAKIGFSQSYTYFTWRFTKREFIDYMTELTRPPVGDFFRPNFWPNTPDILAVSLQNQKPPAFVIRYLLAATLSSNCGIYGPAFELCENTPLPGREEYLDSEKYEIKSWDWNRQGNIRKVISSINAVRRRYKALQSTNNLVFCHNDNEAVLSFVKTDAEKGGLLVIVNLDPVHVQAGWVKVPGHLLGIDVSQPFLAKDALSGQSYTWNSEWNYFNLDPGRAPAHVFEFNQPIT